MRKFYILFFLLVTMVFANAATSVEPQVKQVVVNGSYNLRQPAATVLTILPFNASTAGRVVLHFDGYCVADSGDRIVVAASDDSLWLSNYGNVSVEVANNQTRSRSFSHTMVYDIAAGADTFYAVAQNLVDTNGSGHASIYGHLTLEFFPATGGAFAIYKNIIANPDFNSGPKVLDKAFAIGGVPNGTVVAHANGWVDSDPGDRIMLTAGKTHSWLVGDGSVAVKALNSAQRLSPFSHSRMFDAWANDPDSLFLNAANVVDASGSGVAWVYGTLTGEYFPSTGIASTDVREIELDDVPIRANPVAFDSITITAAQAGYVYLQLDGYATTQVGDRIVMAVSDHYGWEPQEGCVQFAGAYQLNKFNSFSHSRVYPVTAGTHTFYSVAQNVVDTSGNGLLDFAGNFSLKYYPEASVGIAEVESGAGFSMFPNPANNLVTVLLNTGHANQTIELTDLTGRLLQSIPTGNEQQLQLNLQGLPAGMYLVRCNSATQKLLVE